MLLAAALALAPPARGADTYIGAGVSMTVAPDSCSSLAPVISAGWHHQTPTGPVKLFGRPEAMIRAMPCNGAVLTGGGRAGLLLGPVGLGVSGQAGPGYSFDWSEASLHVQPAALVSLQLGRVEWTVLRAGIGLGYLGQGWIEADSQLSWRF